MNNKIKVIDLLNKIANGEKVPKKVKYIDVYYEYEKESGQYISCNKTYLLFDFDESLKMQEQLNDEVEIIEENKIERLNTKSQQFNIYQMVLANKINEIIDYINKKEE